MAADVICPKCDRVVDIIIYHVDNNDCEKLGIKKKKTYNVFNKQHLHWYCKCGYDDTMPTKDSGED